LIIAANGDHDEAVPMCVWSSEIRDDLEAAIVVVQIGDNDHNHDPDEWCSWLSCSCLCPYWCKDKHKNDHEADDNYDRKYDHGHDISEWCS